MKVSKQISLSRDKATEFLTKIIGKKIGKEIIQCEVADDFVLTTVADETNGFSTIQKITICNDEVGSILTKFVAKKFSTDIVGVSIDSDYFVFTTTTTELEQTEHAE
jgi:hypothetical protein